MRQRSKRCLNKVNRIVVRDRKQKSPILNPKLNTNRNSKTPPKQPKEIKVKAKEDKPQKNTDRKKAVVKKKKSASEQKLFKVKKQKVSEDEIQIKENECEVEAQVVTANIQTENEEESKKDIQNDLEDSDESLEEIIKIQSPKVEVNIQEDCKENSCTEEDSEFLTPFEIKRLIKESSQTKEMIIESLVFPSVKNSSKILKQIKEISITSIQEIQNCFQRMIDTERKLRDYEFKSSNCAMKKSISHSKFKYIKPRIRYNSSPYSKDREERSYKVNDHHKCPNYLKYIKNPELSNGRFEYSAKGDVEMAHTDNGQSESSRNKSSRDEVIEFNPEKLSDQCSDSNSNKNNQYNCLGIDEQEAKKYINHANDNGANCANVHSQEEQRYGQERSSQVLEYTSKLHDPFNIYNEINFSHKLPYLKQKEDSSEDIIVVNDSDNEIIVPLEMEVQHLDQSDCDFGH